jgi:ABC-type phosphate transport system auxiliary subunit
MARMGIYDQIKTAFQDLIAPALHELRGQIEVLRVDNRRIDGKVDSLQAQMGSMKNELISEIRRVDVRIDSVDRELRVAIDIRERLAALEARRA